MSKLIVLPLIFLMITVSSAFELNNTSGTIITKDDVAPLVAEFESRQGIAVEKVDIYFDEYEIRYKVYGFREEQRGMSYIKTPKIYILDSNWNIIKEQDASKIGLKYIFLGVPGILVNTMFKIIGLV